jgi:hypothetical protein
MGTDCPQVLVASNPATRAGVGTAMSRGLRRMGQMLCGLRGHDEVRRYERNRFALECTVCGHVSQGWEVDGPLPQQRYSGDPGRHQLRRSARRVA